MGEPFRMPAIPKNPKPRHYRIKQITLLDTENGEHYFRILASKGSAYAYVVDTLYNMDFPMAASDMGIRDYQSDPEYFKEQMLAWEDDPSHFDEDMSLMFYARGEWHTINYEMTTADAMKCLRDAEYGIEKLLEVNSGDAVLFNGYIFYDEEDDVWTQDTDMPEGGEDYGWRDIWGTEIENVHPEPYGPYGEYLGDEPEYD